MVDKQYQELSGAVADGFIELADKVEAALAGKPAARQSRRRGRPHSAVACAGRESRATRPRMEGPRRRRGQKRLLFGPAYRGEGMDAALDWFAKRERL